MIGINRYLVTEMNEELHTRIKDQIEELRDLGYQNSAMLFDLESRLDQIAEWQTEMESEYKATNIEELYENLYALIINLCSIALNNQRSSMEVSKRLDRMEGLLKSIDTKTSTAASILEDQIKFSE
jgi:hypothetical protein